ncbi:MAG: ribonuclease HI [Desulfobacteraceae bacterium]|nr:MAG: ribonuclease HI [Desulfobacteraceae bacterium]
MAFIEIFTDGACSGNPGPGGYGAIIKYGHDFKEISGCDPYTTNNRMELLAVIEALRLLEKPSKVKITTDSNYVVKGMSEWLSSWIKNNWLNSQKKPVLNKDLWEILNNLTRPHEIQWIWIKGHNGHAENEHCDQIARNALKNCQKKPKLDEL